MRVRARLHRQMDVLAHGVGLGHRGDDAIAEVVRVRAREPQRVARRRRRPQRAASRRSRIHRRDTSSPSVRAARLRSCPRRRRLDFAHDVGEPPAALGTARRRHDAVGAAVVAAALHGNPRFDLVEAARLKVLVVLLEVERRGDRPLAVARALRSTPAMRDSRRAQ